VAIAAGLWLVPTVVVINIFLITFFAAANVLKLVLVRRGLDDPCSITVDPSAWQDVVDWPVYTILLPVYRETSVLRQLVRGIERLDYPPDSLDVKLLVEEDDTEMIEAASAMALPSYFDICLVPDVGQRGKPRACNYGLSRARGEFLVIYDAEDRPEPDQLKKSVLAFAQADSSVVCLQAKLNYFNRPHNLLTRWFTAEYSMWFDQMLPGLQSMDAAIPLGGTSNHFILERIDEIGGWNSYNVTEDADLGMRIYLMGWQTAVLDSTTYEEATSKLGNWVRQRSRWVKGYMQTYLFYMRHPKQMLERMGVRTFSIFVLFFGMGTLCLLINPIYWLLTVAWFTTHWSGIEAVFPRPALYLGTLGLFIGNAAFTLTAIAGCFGRRNYGDVKWMLLFPIYWILMSVAAWKGFIQLLYKPSYWEKTAHGFCAFEEDAPHGTSGAGAVQAASYGMSSAT
jgi:cellulose synthase/poly-beta-1,6-N-acetylglucosamine synthase-like glycosyltransferase